MQIDPRLCRDYDHTQKIFNRITITKEEFSLLYKISKSNTDLRISNTINVPNFLKFGSSKNALVRINIIDLACFMSGVEVTDKLKHGMLYDYLFKKYKTVIITRKIFCYELNISLATLSNKMRKDKEFIPIFKKGKKKNSPIFFNISDVVDSLLKTIKTL